MEHEIGATVDAFQIAGVGAIFLGGEVDGSTEEGPVINLDQM
jgi:hypothetical protein